MDLGLAKCEMRKKPRVKVLVSACGWLPLGADKGSAIKWQEG